MLGKGLLISIVMSELCSGNPGVGDLGGAVLGGGDLGGEDVGGGELVLRSAAACPGIEILKILLAWGMVLVFTAKF